MPEGERAGCSTFHDQLAAMNSAVVSPAKRDQIFGIVWPAFGTQSEVVRIYENGVRAARNAAAPPVPS